MDDLLDAIGLLDQVACITDSALAGKFSLEQIFIRKELAIRSKDRWGPLRRASRSAQKPGPTQ